MFNHRSKTVMTSLTLVACAALVAACGDKSAPTKTDGSAPPDGQVAFPTPEAAVKAIADVVGTNDDKRVNEIFGADGADMLRSGDEVADEQAAQRVKAEILEKVAFEDRDADTKVALFGNEGWPFPVPLVHSADGWRFDVDAGWEEIENRRVGRNELFTISTLHEFVEAQREYASVGRDGNPPAFAQKLLSAEGKHDGLYWAVAEGETPSPFGPEVAAAAAEGYHKSEDGPTPFHGYKYRLLTGQGASAPGGAKSFLDGKGLLTGGFALIAWPAKHDNSGVMTFIVNQKGVLFQRDLGESTETAAAAITAYDPDAKWDPVQDK